jgi:hypothetical protein
MPYDFKFLKVTFGFTIPSTDERALVNTNWAKDDGSFDPEAYRSSYIQGFANLMAQPLANFMGGNPTYLRWANYSYLDYVRFACIGTDGKTLGVSYPYVVAPDPNPHGVDTTGIPPQMSVVGSTWNGEPYNRSNKGRLYFPHCQLLQAASSPTASAVTAEIIRDAFRSLVNAWVNVVNAELLTTNMALMIMSKVRDSDGVTQVAVGRVNDTQRRRRAQLEEGKLYRTLA